VVVAVEAEAEAAGEGKNFLGRTPMKTKSYLITSAIILSVTSPSRSRRLHWPRRLTRRKAQRQLQTHKSSLALKEAAESLIAAAESFDTAALMEILVPRAKTW
jgi:hypothetical protein